jgi:hypothetical protein
MPVATRIGLWASRLNRLSRTGRVVLTWLITLELVALVSIFVDKLLIDQVIQGDVGAMTPALIEAGIGAVLYLLGWWLLVGFDSDPQNPWQARTSTVLYVAAGVAVLILLIVLALFGLAFGYIL